MSNTTDIDAPQSEIASPISELANIVNFVMMPLALVVVILVLNGQAGDLRVWLTVALFVFGPGSGLVQFFRLPHAALQLGILFGLSGAVDILLAEALLSIHNISGDAAVCLLAGITFIRPFRLTSNEKAT